MLHWLPSVLSKQQRLFWGLWLLIFTIHAIVLVGYLVYSKPQPLTIHISKGLLRGDRVVRVLPFVRSTGQLQRVFESGKNTKKTRRITTRKAGRRTQVVKQARKVEPVSVHTTKLVTKKNESKKLKITKQQKSAAKKSKPVMAKPVGTELITHEPEHAKHEQVKPAQAQLAQTKFEQTKFEQTKSEPLSSNQENGADEVSEESGPLDVTVGASEMQDDSPVVLGQEEFELLQAYRVIYDQMNQHWHPPAGLKPKHDCIVLATINNRGLAEQVRIEQASGVLAYDIAARMAVSRTQFPKQIWSQQVRLHF